MNQQERDALREKHRVGQNEADDQCQSCYSPDGYPCDVITVLDDLDQIAFWVDHRNGMDVHGAIGRIQDMLHGAWEEVMPTDITSCDIHEELAKALIRDPSMVCECPKCGEEL
jgi:hypothetical protein